LLRDSSLLDPRLILFCCRILAVSRPILHPFPEITGATGKKERFMKHEFNKGVVVLLVALLPFLAFAGETATPQPRALPKPVVTVVELSAAEAQALAEARDEYASQRAQLRAEYEARIDAVLARETNGNS